METPVFSFETSPEYTQVCCDVNDNIISAVKRQADDTNVKCLAVKCPEAVDERHEKFNCITYKTTSDTDVTCRVELHNSSSTVTFSGLTTALFESPHDFNEKLAVAFTGSQVEGSIELANKYAITGIDIFRNMIVDKHSGIDFLLSSKSNLVWLYYNNSYPIDPDNIVAPNLQCITLPNALFAEKYKIQNLLDRYNNQLLFFMMVDDRDVFTPLSILKYPDTIRYLYATVYDTKLIPAACEVVQLGSEHATGDIETFVEKAINSGRTSGSLAIYNPELATNVKINGVSLATAASGVENAGIVWDSNGVRIASVPKPLRPTCFNYREILLNQQ